MAACATPAEFALLEGHLQAAINQWQPPPAPLAAGLTGLQLLGTLCLVMLPCSYHVATM